MPMMQQQCACAPGSGFNGAFNRDGADAFGGGQQGHLEGCRGSVLVMIASHAILLTIGLPHILLWKRNPVLADQLTMYHH